MSDSPDVIRADIENTREELSLDVDALADKVNPAKIVHRRTSRVKSSLGRLRDRVMGAADDAGSSASATASHLGDTASGIAHDVKAKAEGNPLAVGLIAFGAGLLAASLIPASSKEKELAQTAKEQAQPLVQEVTNIAKESAEHLKEPAQDAATAVKERAQEAVQTVREEGMDATSGVKDRLQEAQENVREN